MKVKEYLIGRILQLEAEITSLKLEVESKEEDCNCYRYNNEDLREQLEKAHQFENNVLKFAKYLRFVPSGKDAFITSGRKSDGLLWKSNDPELFKFVRENLLYDLDDEGNVLEDLKPKEGNDEYYIAF